MSVRRRPDRGNRPEVRWKEGGRHRSRLFDKVRDAEAFDREIKRSRQLGALSPTVVQSRMTLTDFVVEEWWPKYVVPNLEESTREVYGQIWAKHLLPRVGGYELRQLTPALVEDLRAQMHIADVGGPTQVKALGILQGICKRAVVRGLIQSNPVLPVDKPRQTTRLQLDPLPPIVVERMRAAMEPRDAILVSVLAYAGLRPEEGAAPPLAGCARADAPRLCGQDEAAARGRSSSSAGARPSRVEAAVEQLFARRSHRSLARRRRVEELRLEQLA